MSVAECPNSACMVPIGVSTPSSIVAWLCLRRCHVTPEGPNFFAAGFRCFSHPCLWPPSCEAACKGFSGTFTEGAFRDEVGWASGLSSGKWAYSNEYLMRRARHAVLTTLYSRAQQPGRAGAFLEGHMQTAAQTPDELQNGIRFRF